MPKMKTNRAAAKRFRALGSGKLKFKRTHRSHLLSNRSQKRKRQLRGSGIVDKTDAIRLARCLPYAVKR